MAKTGLAAASAALFLAAPAVLPGAAAQSFVAEDEFDRGRLQRIEPNPEGVSPRYAYTKGRQVFLDMTGELQVPDGVYPGPFVLCSGGTCGAANAAVAGARIVLSSDAVPDPDEARYCWDGAANCTVATEDGAPLPPFRVAVQ